MQHYQDVLQDRSGNAIAGAIVTVVYNSTSLPADLYSDYAGTQPLTTVITDADGSYSFYVSSGRYDYAFYKNGKLLKTETDVFIDQSTALQDLSTSAGASLVGFNPAGTISSTTVQTAIEEINTDLAATIGAGLVGFKQSGTGAVSRTVENKNKEEISVMDFIPMGTDTSTVDCSTYIQNALTYIEFIGGGILKFPKGIFKTSVNLIVSSNTTLQGSGKGTVIKSLTLNLPSSVGHRQIDLVGVSGVIIKHITFDAGSMTGFLGGMRSIYANGSNNYIVDECEFITPGAAIASVNCNNYKVSNNIITIQVYDSVSKHDGVIDQWDGSYNFIIENNTINGSTIALYPILVTGNNSTNTVGTPVYNFIITKNKIFNAKICGVWIQGRLGLAYDFSIAENTINNITGTTEGIGVLITESYNFLVSENIISNTYRSSITARSESGLVADYSAKYGSINNNICENANTSLATSTYSGATIAIGGSSSHISVENNVIKGTLCAYSIVVFQDASYIDVIGNNYEPGTLGWVYRGSTNDKYNSYPDSVRIGNRSFANNAYINFNTSGLINSVSYDSQIIASGGSTTNNAGSLSLLAANIGFTGLTTMTGATAITGSAATSLSISGALTGSTITQGIRTIQTISSDVTNTAYMFLSQPATQATSFTLGQLMHFAAAGQSFTGGSVVTSQFGFYSGSGLTGATTNYGFYGNIPAGANRYNFYANGTAANYFAGNTYTASGTTTMTDGFFYIPTAAGAPTGVPTAISGRVPMYYDSTNNRFYVYNGAWKSVVLA